MPNDVGAIQKFKKEVLNLLEEIERRQKIFEFLKTLPPNEQTAYLDCAKQYDEKATEIAEQVFKKQFEKDFANGQFAEKVGNALNNALKELSNESKNQKETGWTGNVQ